MRKTKSTKQPTKVEKTVNRKRKLSNRNFTKNGETHSSIRRVPLVKNQLKS